MIEESLSLSLYLVGGFICAFFVTFVLRNDINRKIYTIIFGYIIGFVFGIVIVFIIKLIFNLKISDMSILLTLIEKENRIILIYYIILFIIGLLAYNKNSVLFSILMLAILPLLIINVFYPIVASSSSFLSFIAMLGLGILGIIGLGIIIYAKTKIENENTQKGVTYIGTIVMVCGFFPMFNLIITVLIPRTSVAQSLIYYFITILTIVGIKKKYKTFDTDMCLNPTTFTDKRCISYLDTKCKITPDDEICQKYKYNYEK